MESINNKNMLQGQRNPPLVMHPTLSLGPPSQPWIYHHRILFYREDPRTQALCYSILKN